MLTDASSTDSDADIKKLESGNKFLKLLALSKVKHEANLFLKDDINDTDSRLLHGVYQDRVLTSKEVKHEPAFVFDRLRLAKDEARELARKKKQQNQLKQRRASMNKDGSDFDGLSADINSHRQENEEVMRSSFIMMPVGINRKGLKQTAPIMLSPTKLNTKDLNGQEFEAEEVDNPVVISPVGKKTKRKNKNSNFRNKKG